MKRISTIAALCLISSGAIAFDQHKALQTANNLSHEHLICAAYAAIVSACMLHRDNPDQPTSQRYRELGEDFTVRGLRIGRIANVSRKASEARLDMAYQGMMTNIENNCSNISILLHQHSDACIALYSDGPDRLADVMR